MDIQNYAVGWDSPAEWKEVPHGPQTLFLYTNNDKLLLRGSVNQVYSEVNPTPDLDARSLAEYYIASTRENMPGWTAEHVGEQPAADATWHLVRRETKDFKILIGYAVKGNTTVIVSLSGRGPSSLAVEPELDSFRTFLKSIRLTEQEIPPGRL